MPQFQCRMVGNALVPVRETDKAQASKLPKGRTILVKIDGPRNAARHRLLFALVKTAFDNWPEQHRFRPVDPEHLRKWLLCQAGHENRSAIMATGGDGVAVERSLDGFVCAHVGAGAVFFEVRDHTLTARAPRSVSYRGCDEATFRAVLERVVGVIETEVGVPAEELRRHVAIETREAQRRRYEFNISARCRMRTP